MHNDDVMARMTALERSDVLEPTQIWRPSTRPFIVAVMAFKGGVGKTTFAYELAWLLNAVLVDLDWDDGGATVQWGYRHKNYVRAPLLDALERGTAPAPLYGTRKPLLVPGHPDLSAQTYPASVYADAIEAWAKSWNRVVVVDTHPGGLESTMGAAAAANIIVSPTKLATKELNGTEGMLEAMPDYPLMIVPNMVAAIPPAAETERLGRMAATAGVPIGPLVSRYPWLERRKIRVSLTSYEKVPARIAALDGELRAVGEAVMAYVGP